jgi:alcohol dehydrogenase class IV
LKPDQIMTDVINQFTFSTAPKLHFGRGALSDLVAVAGEMIGRRCLIVTDQGLLATGIVASAQNALAQHQIHSDLFAEVEADPSEATVLAAVRQAKAQKPDCVIGLGGGSSLDVAKLVAYLAASDENIEEIYGVGQAKGARLPLVLVPTTAGTGSEVTPISIVTTGANEKMGVVSPVLLPDLALLDPELTIGLPPSITAATGIDAMVHAIEAYASASPNNNPISKTLALEALRLIGASLHTGVSDGGNIGARSQLMLGSMLAGQAFANAPVAAVHALAYPIGGHFKVPHGLSNALVLPHVLRFNSVTSASAYAQTAIAAFPELATVPDSDRALAFCEELSALSQKCGLPQRLRDVGIDQDSIPLLARDASKQTRLLVNNPRELSEHDIFQIYEAAW